MISFNEFKKIELIAAKISGVEDIEGKDKLYKIKIDIGSGEKQIVAGVKEFYPKEDLEGKTIIVVNNLEPAAIGGQKSEAMLLAAKNNEGKYSIVFLDGNISPGTMVE